MTGILARREGYSTTGQEGEILHTGTCRMEEYCTLASRERYYRLATREGYTTLARKRDTACWLGGR